MGCGEKQSTNTNDGNNTPEKPAKKNVEKETPASTSWVSDLSDPNNVKIEAAIRSSLGKPEGELTRVDLEKVTGLRLYHKQLTELPKEMEKLTQLTKLSLLGNRSTDVTSLEKLTQLTNLSLDGNKLIELPNGLEKLTQLTWLSLDDNLLTDVEGLENLTQLEYLGLGGNRLSDMEGLENLTQLTKLSLKRNELTDVKGLEKLAKLTTLDLRLNQLTDVKGLEKLTKLEYLYLSLNPDLTKAQIAELQKALPKCKIGSSPKK